MYTKIAWLAIVMCLTLEAVHGADLRKRWIRKWQDFDQDEDGKLLQPDIDHWTDAILSGSNTAACQEAVQVGVDFFDLFPTDHEVTVEEAVFKFAELQCAGYLYNIYKTYKRAVAVCFDDDNDGKLSKEEFRILVNAYDFKVNPYSVFRHLDINNDNYVSGDEYTDAYVDFYTNAVVEDADVVGLDRAF